MVLGQRWGWTRFEIITLIINQSFEGFSGGSHLQKKGALVDALRFVLIPQPETG